MDHRNSTADDISAVIGFTATARICSWFGRCNLYVPLTPTLTHPIARLIGVSAFERLCKEFGGDYLSLPSDRTVENDLRDRELAELLGEGYTVSEIAERIGISTRRVQQLRREIEASGLIPLVMEKPAGKGPLQKPPGKLRVVKG